MTDLKKSVLGCFEDSFSIKSSLKWARIFEKVWESLNRKCWNRLIFERRRFQERSRKETWLDFWRETFWIEAEPFETPQDKHNYSKIAILTYHFIRNFGLEDVDCGMEVKTRMLLWEVSFWRTSHRARMIDQRLRIKSWTHVLRFWKC